MKPLKQQWLLLKHGAPIESAIGGIVFSDTQNPGFELLEIKNDFVKARYIEKIEVLERVSDPFGVSQEVLTVRYVYFDFTVSAVGSGVSLVKIFRPPLSLKNFISTVSLALDHAASVSKVSFDLRKIYEAISKNPDINRLLVSKVSASQIPIGNDSVAKVEVVSTGDALLELLKTYSNPYVRLDRLSMTARMDFESEALEVSATGSIVCTAGLEAVLQNLVCAN